MNNRRFTGWTAVISALAVVALCGACRADDPPGIGTVTMTVCGPMGRPLPNQVVRWFPAWFDYLGTPIPPGATNAAGQVTVRLDAGLHRLRVVVPGVGFGSTGMIVVRADQDAHVPLPPLAAFAHISGVVSAALRAPDETVKADSPFSGPAELPPPATVDAQGRFQLNDIYPGHVQLALTAGPTHNSYQQVDVAPGEVLTGVEFTPPFANIGTPAPLLPTATVAIRGTVTDTAGTPIPNAEVYADVPQPRTSPVPRISGGPYRKPLAPLTAITNSNGGYVIPGVVLSSYKEQIRFWAEHPGFPPATLLVETKEGQRGDVKADLILPLQHTQLTVRALENGAPVAGARIQVGPTFYEDRVDSNNGPFPDSGASARMFSIGPQLTAVTDKDGTARFIDLPPGLWDVSATTGPPNAPSVTSIGPATVQAGRASSCIMRVQSRKPINICVDIDGPDGRQLQWQQVNIGSTGPAGPGGQVSGAALEPGGDGEFPRAQYHAPGTDAGLYQVTVRTRDFPTPQGWYADTMGPYLEAAGLVAVSDDLPWPQPLSLQTQRHEPSTVSVRLQDSSGRPVRGTVVIDAFAGSSDYAASTDASGAVDFPDMASGQYTVRGYLAGQPLPTALHDYGPAPPDTVLVGQTSIPPQQITIGSDERPLVVLRPQPVGYLRLHLALTSPETPKEFWLMDSSRSFAADTVPGQREDDQTGGILYGPTLTGPDTLYVTHATPNGQSYRAGTAPVVIRHDAVAAVNLTPVRPDARTSGDPDDTDRVTGTVLLNDGKTPAWNASVVVLRPFHGMSGDLETAQQPTDALGRLLGMTAGLDQRFFLPPRVVIDHVLPPIPPTGVDPPEPVVVAWLPGFAGAAVVPYVSGQPVRIVLPPSLVATGRVTVAGQPVAALNAKFRIRAALQDRGSLNDLLTLDTTAQPDGSFTLSGLTPGTYRVQAARNGIWLSTSQTFVVGSAPLPPLLLDIPAPGIFITLHLKDTEGHALPGRTVALDTPPGPLADLFWPASVTADGAGDLHLDGLSAGHHVLREPGAGPFAGPQIAAFDVLSYTSGISYNLDRLQVVLPQTAHKAETAL